MKTIEFRGYSDDTFGFEIIGDRGKVIDGDDHDDCANSTVRAFRVASESTGTAFIVIGVYGMCPDGTWAIGISPDNEDIEIPEWATSPRFRTDGYSPRMTLQAPDDATVKLVCVDGKAPPTKEEE